MENAFSEVDAKLDEWTAADYQKQAKLFIQDGKEIYKNEYDKTTRCVKDTQEELYQRAQYKNLLLKELGCTITTTLTDFSTFDFSDKINIAPVIDDVNKYNDFDKRVENVLPHPEVPSVIDILVNTNEYRKAKEQYNEARRYKAMMCNESEKMQCLQAKMNEICSFVKSERVELDFLVKKLKAMTTELESGMPKTF